ncbi:hypothetical protein NS355_17855, partial [Sphingomonas yabuuchiae]
CSRFGVVVFQQKTASDRGVRLVGSERGIEDRNGTIARMAENTVPFSEAPVPSGEPVAAVLELVGGRSAELGISEGDSVSWPK